MSEQKYYYIAIDKQAKTIQLRAYQPNSCDAREYNILANEYGISNHNSAFMNNRFSIFFNGTKNHIDYSTFYKKYSKYEVLEAKNLMKLQDEYNGLVTKFQSIAEKIPPYAEQLKANGNYKDFETRLAYDCLHAVLSSSTICEWYDKYNCIDSHITTLAKKALKAVYTI